MSSSRPALLMAGLSASATAIPASLLFSLAGIAFVSGYDGLAYGLGLTAGLALYAVLVSAQLSQSRASSLEAFIRARYGRSAAVLATAVLAISILLLLAAEISLLASLAERFALLPFETAVLLAAAMILVLSLVLRSPAANHIRATLFAAMALGLVGAAILIAWGTASALIPHLSLGTALSEIQSLETQMLESGSAELRTFRLYTKPFLAADQLAFVAIVVTLAAGTLVAASITTQTQLPPEKRSARLAAGWSALLAMLLVISAPPIAGFVKLAIYNDLVRGTPLTALPPYLEQASRLGLVRIHGTSAKLLDDVTTAVAKGHTDPAAVTAHFKDTAATALPMWSELKPQTKAAMVESARQMLTATGLDTWSLLQAGVLPQAATAAGNKTGMLTHASLAIDAAAIPVMLPAMTPAPALAAGLLLVFGCAAAFAVAGTLMSKLGAAVADESDTRSSGLVLPALIVASAAAIAVGLQHEDPAKLAATALSIAGAALAPALVLGLWWRRASAPAACLSIAAGLAFTMYYAVGTEFFPAAFYETWPTLSNASDSAARKFQSLTSAIEKAVDTDAKAAAIAARDAFASGTASRPGIANWLGIDSAGAALFGLPTSLLVMLLVSFVSRARD